MNYPQALEELISDFMRYPGIGRKTAERYALFTLDKWSQEDLETFAMHVSHIKQTIRRCMICGHLTDIDPCAICQDPSRDPHTLIVVESPKDVFSIERSGKYKGVYHVLHGALSPMDGVGPDELNLKKLWERLHEQPISEVIIATSGTQEGESTAMYIHRVMKNTDIRISRIGYGVPVGTNVEYADDQTLVKAIENRRTI